MGDDSASDVAAAKLDDDEDPSVTAVADEPAVTRERAPEIKPGDLLAGRYQIEGVLGKGGSGVVLRAYDRVSATVVAVKVLKPGLTHDPRWEKRFQRELRLGRPVRHPNVCRIFDIGDADGYRFLTMEYATGGTLRDLIKKNEPLRPMPERIADAAGVIAGLAAIHGAGIVHRDVKPDNVLRMDDGRLVLSDFGLATDLPDSTMVSVFVGTPHYMAPEVREGDPATTRSDVWSLGVVLHEIFFGKRPERRTVRSVSGVSKSSAASTSSIVERAMLALCTRCLADDPADRPEDARAVDRLFDNARRSPFSLLRSPRRRFIPFAAFAVVAVMASVGIGVRANRRDRVPAAATSRSVSMLVPAGEPADWTRIAKTITTVPGHVHCFSSLDARTIRVIWGAPRRAEDVDLETGTRVRAALAAETFATGCPDLSPDRKSLLFTAHTGAGGTEIRHSSQADGSDARPITAGSDPVWLRNADDFVYSIDSTHAALFSLPTMRFHLLEDPGLGAQLAILDKSASRQTDAVALMLLGSDLQWAIAVYEGASLNRKSIFSIPAARGLRFSPVGDRIFVSPQQQQSSLVSLDLRAGTYRKIGRYGELDLLDLLVGGNHTAVLARKRTRDVWLYGAAGRRRLTTDGQSVDAALSATGELLVARSVGSNVNIWSLSREGALRKLTNGQLDGTPDFSPDGTTWAYADYREKSINLCVTATGTCRVLRRDEMLPESPRFSPDGSKLAFVTQSGVSHLIVVSLANGKEWQVGDTHWQCPPVWSSPTRLWGIEGTPGKYSWVERDVENRARTGKRLEIKHHQSAANDDFECWPHDVDETSPFFQRVRVETEEISSIVLLPRNSPD